MSGVISQLRPLGVCMNLQTLNLVTVSHGARTGSKPEKIWLLLLKNCRSEETLGALSPQIVLYRVLKVEFLEQL